MSILHYDLAGADPEIFFSPFCWRIRMALLHKGLEFEVHPWRFSERSATADSGHNSVPIIRDGESWVGDSWEIARYLDLQYPTRPTLMAGPEGEAHARLVSGLCGTLIFPAVIRIALLPAYGLLDDGSKPYFRESREQMFGKRLEDIHADEATGRAGLGTALAPFDEVLTACPFINGAEPAYADYLLFGVLKWPDIVSAYAPLDDTSAVGRWFDRMNSLYDGYAGKARTVRD